MTLTDVFSALGLGIAGFMATSGDNLVLLLGMHADRTFRARDIAWGYVGTVVLVVMVGRILAILAHRAPPGLIGYLGIVPIGLGVYQLASLLKRKDPHASIHVRPASRWTGVTAVTLVMLAASTDSLAVFAAIFADTRPPLGLVVLTSAVGCAVLLAVGARRLVHHTELGERISRAAPYVMPFLLIAIGIFILADTPTDVDMPAAYDSAREPSTSHVHSPIENAPG